MTTIAETHGTSTLDNKLGAVIAFGQGMAIPYRFP